MDVKIRADDTVEISGYVNAVERLSKPLWSRLGQFVEKIAAGAFSRAIQRNDDVKVLLNHDANRELGTTKDGSLKLTEDNIGLRACFTTKDEEVVEDARNNRLVGWSFGFTDKDVEPGEVDGMPLRYVKDLNLFEVSLLNDRCTPAYNGTLVNARNEQETICYGDTAKEDVNIRAEENPEPKPEPPVYDNSKYKKIIEEMKK